MYVCMYVCVYIYIGIRMYAYLIILYYVINCYIILYSGHADHGPSARRGGSLEAPHGFEDRGQTKST